MTIARHNFRAMSVLRDLRRKTGLTQAALASLAGTSQPQIKRLENGERQLTKRWAVRLAPHLQVSAQELMFSDNDDEETDNIRGVVGLQVLGTSRAGDWLDITLMDDDSEKEVIHVAASTRFPRARQYALKVAGDSMNEKFADGSFVIVVDFAESGLALKPGMIVHVERTRAGGQLVETTIKEASKDLRHLLPRSSNPIHKPIPIAGTDDIEIAIKGVVIGKYEEVDLPT